MKFTLFSFRLFDLENRSLFTIRLLEFTRSSSDAATKKDLEPFKEYLVKQAEVASSLRTVTERLTKVGDRLTADEKEIAALQTGDVSAEVEQAVNALNAQIEILDPQVPPVGDGTPTPAPAQ